MSLSWLEYRELRDNEITSQTERTIDIQWPWGLSVTWFRRFPDYVYFSIYRRYITIKVPIETIDEVINILDYIRIWSHTIEREES